MNTTIDEEQCIVAPDVSALQNNGWHIGSAIGPYCSAWKDCEDVLFIWKDSAWQRVH